MMSPELLFLATLDITPAFWYSLTRRSKKFLWCTVRVVSGRS